MRRFVLLLLCALALPLRADKLSDDIDALLQRTFPPDEPGAAVLVAKDGKQILRKGYGLADLELNVPVRPAMIFRLGSVTKQFTAVAILQLVQQGKVSLSDDITKYLPDYPTQGKKITIENLLTHTSGIKDYLTLPYEPMKNYTVSELIGVFKDRPLEFEPGAKWKYSNSGYVLLGAVIEKVSGESYENYLMAHIFLPLGMTRTRYESPSTVLRDRAHPYIRTGETWSNAEPVSFSVVYSAGALISTVDDLARWDAALNDDTVVPQALLAKAFTPFKLADGSSSGYGYGWIISNYEGHRIVDHNGLVQGGDAEILRMPDDHVLVVVLSNGIRRQPQQRLTAQRIASMVIGKPLAADATTMPGDGLMAHMSKRAVDPKVAKVDPKIYDRYVGRYQIAPNFVLSVTREGDQLFTQATGQQKLEVLPTAETEFFVRDVDASLTFEPDAVVLHQGGSNVRAPRLREGAAFIPPPPPPKEGKVDPAVFEQLVGMYQLTPEFSIAITRDGVHLYEQATAQPRFEIYPISENEYFLKVVDARIVFVRDGTGRASKLILYQNGLQQEGRRVP